ncbi:MAG: TatD family hydrolase [Bacilli bacterium]|nr:TatD family hydrolase [Bacilli bacterium]
MYIDTHSHLNSKVLYEKLEEVIKEAIDNQVELFIVPGFDFETSVIALELAKKYPFVYAAIGYHPTEIKGYGEKEYKWLEEHINDEKVVALGEIGYDFHWDTTTKEEQTEAFVRQISIAKKAGKPLIIHSRDAIQLTLDTLKETNAKMVGGVMHAYSGSLEMAPLFIKENFYLGIGGPVTFKNAKEIKRVVEVIPLEHLLSETDSPYLTPHPYRGTENGPKYIPLIVDEIVNIKGINKEEVAKILLANAKKLFKLE